MMLTHLSFWSKMIKNDSKNYLSQRNSIPLHNVYDFKFMVSNLSVPFHI